jgi:hypothetical protein
MGRLLRRRADSRRRDPDSREQSLTMKKVEDRSPATPQDAAARKITLSRAIDAYRAKPFVPGIGFCPLTQDDEIMLDRLRASKDAAKAFAKFLLDEAKGAIFISDCVMAQRYATGEHAKQVRSRIPLTALSKARKKFGDLKDSLQEAWLLAVCSEEIDSVALAINNENFYRRRWDRSLSRKGDQDAADSRAIGWVKESVARLSGRPHLETVRIIAAVVLGRDDNENRGWARDHPR